MLVIDGKLHPAFDPTALSRNVRNGVGVAERQGDVRDQRRPVSFGKFARFFRDRLKTPERLVLRRGGKRAVGSGERATPSLDRWSRFSRYPRVSSPARSPVPSFVSDGG